MGKNEALKKLNNLRDRIDFDMKRKNKKELKDYKRMVEEVIKEVERL